MTAIPSAIVLYLKFAFYMVQSSTGRWPIKYRSCCVGKSKRHSPSRDTCISNGEWKGLVKGMRLDAKLTMEVQCRVVASTRTALLVTKKMRNSRCRYTTTFLCISKVELSCVLVSVQCELFCCMVAAKMEEVLGSCWAWGSCGHWLLGS